MYMLKTGEPFNSYVREFLADGGILSTKNQDEAMTFETISSLLRALRRQPEHNAGMTLRIVKQEVTIHEREVS